MAAACCARRGQRGEVAVVERVHGQLGLQRARGRAAAVGQLGERAGEAVVGGAVAAEQVLARGAGGDQPGAHLGELRRDPAQQVLQRLQRLLQPAGRGQRGGQRQEELEAALPVVGRQQAQGGGVPARRLGGRGRRGRVAGLGEHGGGRDVAGRGAALEVVRARGQRSARALQRRRGPRVGGEPPALPRRRVGRAAHDGMAEAVAARDARGGDEAAPDQLVERGEDGVARHLAGRRGEVELGRVAGHRRALEQPPRGLAQPADLLPERRRHRGGQLGAVLARSGAVARSPPPPPRASCSR